MKRRIFDFVIIAAVALSVAGAVWLCSVPRSAEGLYSRYRVALALGMKERMPSPDAGPDLMRAYCDSVWAQPDEHMRLLLKDAVAQSGKRDTLAAFVRRMHEEGRLRRGRDILLMSWDVRDTTWVRCVKGRRHGYRYIAGCYEPGIEKKQKEAYRQMRSRTWAAYQFKVDRDLAKLGRKANFLSFGRDEAVRLYSEEMRQARRVYRERTHALDSVIRLDYRRNVHVRPPRPLKNQYNPLVGVCRKLSFDTPEGRRTVWLAVYEPAYIKGGRSNKFPVRTAGVYSRKESALKMIRSSAYDDFLPEFTKIKKELHRENTRRRR